MNDTYYTAQTLGFFAIALFAQSVIPVLARSFYAWHDTKTPVKIAFFTVAIDIIAALILSRSMGVMGLALAFSIASFIQMLLLLMLLRKKIGSLDDKKIIISITKIIILSGLMGVVVYASRYLINLGVDFTTFMGVLIQGVGAGIIGIVFYLITALIFRCDEINIIAYWLTRARHQIFNGKNSNHV